MTDPQYRQMGGGGATLRYGLNQDAGGSLTWGWTLGQDAPAATGSGLTQNFTVIGRLYAGLQVATCDSTEPVVGTAQYSAVSNYPSA